MKTRRDFIKGSLIMGALAKFPTILFDPIKSDSDFSHDKLSPLFFSCNPDNDLYNILVDNHIEIRKYSTAYDVVSNTPIGGRFVITAQNYPEEGTMIDTKLQELIRKKKLRGYIEFPDMSFNGNDVKPVIRDELGRGVITSDFFNSALNQMSIVSVNGCRLFPVDSSSAVISFAKIAGFDKAIYGLKDAIVYPLLFQLNKILICSTSLSNFVTSRYGPYKSWKIIWERILNWILDGDISLSNLKFDPIPTHSKTNLLRSTDRIESILRGTEWLFNARFFVHPEWETEIFTYIQENPVNPFGAPISKDKKNGDGSLGILEGHASIINLDGSQQYRYWLRADVQGEAAFLLASAGGFFHNDQYRKVAINLLNYLFYTSNLRQDERNKKGSPMYGLIGWTSNFPNVYYSDDNARCLLGVIGATSLLKNTQWDDFIVEGILANFRLTSNQGFFGTHINQDDLTKNGIGFYHNRDFTNFHPHFESWMWACYLWLFDKTGYLPLLEKTRNAIGLTMDAYPENWKWQNGMQQERARMILPLSWLVRVNDTPLHRQWLDFMIEELLKFQSPTGAIREELGIAINGRAGTQKSNSDYGKAEAPLISENGDPVSDLLYTSNFAYFALNEAAHVTKSEEHTRAVNLLSEFLTRVQVKSEKHEDLNGAWFRAFDYDRWEYWASGSDSGWGPWCTLAGWIQNWIVSTHVLVENKTCYWDMTGTRTFDEMDSSVKYFFNI